MLRLSFVGVWLDLRLLWGMTMIPSEKSYLISREGRFWRVMAQNGTKPAAIRSTFQEALRIGRRLAIRQRARLLIRAENGEFRCASLYPLMGRADHFLPSLPNESARNGDSGTKREADGETGLPDRLNLPHSTRTSLPSPTEIASLLALADEVLLLTLEPHGTVPSLGLRLRAENFLRRELGAGSFQVLRTEDWMVWKRGHSRDCVVLLEAINRALAPMSRVRRTRISDWAGPEESELAGAG